MDFAPKSDIFSSIKQAIVRDNHEKDTEFSASYVPILTGVTPGQKSQTFTEDIRPEPLLQSLS